MGKISLMEKPGSYVYFAFHGDTFQPSIITKHLNVSPTDSWGKGDPGKYIRQQKYSCWQISSIQNETLDLNSLVNEVIDKLKDKTEIINWLKVQYQLDTVLEIIMYVDVNEEQSTPMLGHESSVIEFLHNTGTVTDVDIYRYDSRE